MGGIFIVLILSLGCCYMAGSQLKANGNLLALILLVEARRRVEVRRTRLMRGVGLGREATRLTFIAAALAAGQGRRQTNLQRPRSSRRQQW